MISRKRHIVIITTWFPPKNGVAVNRMLGFVKYLDHDSNRITVITDASPDVPNEESYVGAEVHRLGNSRFFRTLSFEAGEHRIIHTAKVLWNMIYSMLVGHIDQKWVTNSLNRLELIHSKQPIDIVISSYAPAGPHLVAGAFLDNHPEVKWIADMRDEMSLNPHLSKSERQALAAVEKVVDTRAALVATVSQPILDDFRNLLPSVPFFEEIRNGFDHDFEFSSSFNSVFTIGYSGTFYGKNKPHTFFRGLKEFLTKYPVPFQLRFIGTSHNFEIPDELRKHSFFLPKMDYQDAIKTMAQMDANLLVLPKVNRRGVFSGKLFDYLSVGKPIIAVVDPNDVAAELINQLQAGFIADFDNEHAISKAIESAYALWDSRTPIQCDTQKIKQLHRRYQVGKLNRWIEQISAE